MILTRFELLTVCIPTDDCDAAEYILSSLFFRHKINGLSTHKDAQALFHVNNIFLKSILMTGSNQLDPNKVFLSKMTREGRSRQFIAQ